MPRGRPGDLQPDSAADSGFILLQNGTYLVLNLEERNPGAAELFGNLGGQITISLAVLPDRY